MHASKTLFFIYQMHILQVRRSWWSYYVQFQCFYVVEQYEYCWSWWRGEERWSISGFTQITTTHTSPCPHPAGLQWFNSVKCVSRPENIFHQTQVRKPRKLTQFYSSDDMRVSASSAQHLNTPVPPLPGSGLGNLIWRVCSSIYLTISEEKWGPTVE